MYNTPAFFIGIWKIARTCIDHTSNSNNNFQGSGKATFKELSNNNDNSLLQYSESLTLNISVANTTNSTQATKQYHYEFKDGDVSIYNEEKSGNAIHCQKMFDLNFINNKSAKGQYECGNDMYNCTFTFLSDTRFSITYKVTGPKKDYTLISIFEKYSAEESDTLAALGSDANPFADT